MGTSTHKFTISMRPRPIYFRGVVEEVYINKEERWGGVFAFLPVGHMVDVQTISNIPQDSNLNDRMNAHTHTLPCLFHVHEGEDRRCDHDAKERRDVLYSDSAYLLCSPRVAGCVAQIACPRVPSRSKYANVKPSHTRRKTVQLLDFPHSGMERVDRIEGVEGLEIHGGPARCARPAEPAGRRARRGGRGSFGLVGVL